MGVMLLGVEAAADEEPKRKTGGGPASAAALVARSPLAAASAASGAATCSDGIQNGAETAVDCGGGTCDPCANGKTCKDDHDCEDNSKCDPKTERCERDAGVALLTICIGAVLASAALGAFLLKVVRAKYRTTEDAQPTVEMGEVVAGIPIGDEGNRRNYLRARLRFAKGRLYASTHAGQGSHMLTYMLGANGIVVLEPEQKVEPEDEVNLRIIERVFR